MKWIKRHKMRSVRAAWT